MSIISIKKTSMVKSKKPISSVIASNMKRDKYLFLLIIPVIVYYLVFHYYPMYGVIIAFKRYSISKGILGSDWVGFKWFLEFFNSFYFSRLLKNTLLLSLYSLIWAFPIPIVFALFLNELKDGIFKRSIQTISYLPHFISVVVIIGMMVNFLNPVDGIINIFITKLGMQPINFFDSPEWFRTLYIASDVWQSMGWNSIIFLAALSNINSELYDAAKIDGCNRLQQIRHVSIPGILPTIIILFILKLGSIMNVGFEKIFLMYRATTYETADVISTYVYRKGIIDAQFSFGAAVGLFNSAINFVVLIASNYLSKKTNETSLW